jgi:tetratricopeptide (TPR) repeat protein
MHLSSLHGVLRIFSVLILGLVILPRGAWAQATDSTQLRRFRMADARLQAGDTEEAIRVLEALHKESPNNASFYRKLKEAYESVKRYDDALRLVNERIDDTPSAELLSEKARLLYQKEAEEKASTAIDEAIARAPARPATYRLVYQTLVDLQRFRQAIDVLQRARSQLDDDSLFRTELAYLYGLDGQHETAMQEYVDLLDASPDRVSLVRSRLQTFVEQGEGIEASISVLEGAVEDQPLNPAYRKLLAWLYMSTDDYEAALDVYRALDRLQQQEGQALFSFAQKAADATQYDVATRAFGAILERHGNAEVAPRTQRALGDAYRQWARDTYGSSPVHRDSVPRYDAARRAYQAFLEKYPNHEAYPVVLSRLGTIQVDVYQKFEAAQSTLQEVVSSYPKTSAADEARYDLGRIALLQDNFERAQVLFSRLTNDLRGGDLADRARFELAQLQFYQGNFEAARTRAQATSANTSSDVANDAIDLSVLIQENKGPDSLNSALRLYARAQLRIRQHRYPDAEARLDSLLQSHRRHPLTDDAQLGRAEVYLAVGDTARAVEAYKQLPEDYPRSPHADRSLFRLGELYQETGRTEPAMETYNHLLTDYPESRLSIEAPNPHRTLQPDQG